MKHGVILVGYSGHAAVVYDILKLNKIICVGYFEEREKNINPLGLVYLGSENSNESIELIKSHDYFISIGNNKIRREISKYIIEKTDKQPVNVIHPTVTLGEKVKIGTGNVFTAHCIINPLSFIGDGVICNTGSIIEHECIIGNFSHVAPGAVLAGNVTIGEGSFIGANSVIREGIKIGNNVLIGAGSVVVSDIPDNVVAFGNPCKPRK